LELATSAPTVDTVRQPGAKSAPWHTALLLFVFLNFLFLLTSTGRVHTIDEISTVIQAENLVLHGSTAVPQAVSAGIWYGKRDLHGEPRSPYPAGQAVAIAPWYAFGHFIMAKLPGIPHGRNSDLIISMAATWSNATYAALAAALAFMLFATVGLTERDALLCALMLALSTPLFVYSGSLFTEPLTAVLFLGAALALFGLPSNSPVSVPRAELAAFLLGLSLYIRPTNLLAAFVFIFALMIRDGRAGLRPAATMLAIVGAFGVAYLARNYALYGSMTDFGYPATAEGGRELNSFHTPLLTGLFGYLFSSGKSIFLFCPPLILAIAALPRLWHRDRGLAAVAVFTPLAYLALYSRLTNWEGGYNYGPRYMMPALVLSCLALAAWFLCPTAWSRKALGVFFAMGLAVQAIGLSTNYMEDMVGNHYYVGNWQYRMSYSAISGQLRLIVKYLDGAPAPLGLGFDRWFLFLPKTGASTAITVALLIPMLLGTAVTGVALAKRLRSTCSC
jgi:hypothetical protein